MASLDEQCVALLDAIADELVDPPDRRFVSPGQPAFDCPQLTLHVTQVVRGTSRQTRPDIGCAPTTATAAVTRTWCVPVASSPRGTPATAQALHASGVDVVAGGWALWQAVAAAGRVVSCPLAIDDMSALDPQGAIAGWQVTARWTI